MLILDNTLRKIQIVLSSAITTNQLPFTASYVDITTTSFTPATNDGATNSTTAVDMVVAPAASTQRQLKFVNIYNADTVAATGTVQLNDNGTTRILIKIALNPGDTLQFIDSEGWSVISNNGQIKTGFSSRQFYMATPTNPTGTTSINPTYVMCGLAGSITPKGSGNVWVVIEGMMLNNTANASDGMSAQIQIGTGTAPINGAASTGTVYGVGTAFLPQAAAANKFVPFTLTAIATGLTIGTTYWIDLGQSAVVGGTGSVINIVITAIEL